MGLLWDISSRLSARRLGALGLWHELAIHLHLLLHELKLLELLKLLKLLKLLILIWRNERVLMVRVLDRIVLEGMTCILLDSFGR